mmetsp:Transcript_16871/g.42348  ORF Transcript_16871/g.42348 Transcript_16871/m.42348 type:complete len:204 (-) Transcript_16871:808-1419(-)
MSPRKQPETQKGRSGWCQAISQHRIRALLGEENLLTYLLKGKSLRVFPTAFGQVRPAGSSQSTPLPMIQDPGHHQHCCSWHPCTAVARQHPASFSRSSTPHADCAASSSTLRATIFHPSTIVNTSSAKFPFQIFRSPGQAIPQGFGYAVCTNSKVREWLFPIESCWRGEGKNPNLQALAKVPGRSLQQQGSALFGQDDLYYRS